jgi:polysaccharide export outer membrane protein
LACDDRVLAIGTHARDYAAHLLDLAYTLGGSRAPALTVSIARPRQIEGRILAALDNSRNRATPPRRSRLAGIAVAAILVVPLAAAEATWVSAPSTPSAELLAAAPPAVRIPAAMPAAAPAPAPPPSAATLATHRIELQTAGQSSVVSQPPVVARSYVIQPGDVLTVLIWKNKDFSGDVVVRPDGMITMPLLNDQQAAGLRPEQLAANLKQGLARFQADPNVTVVVKQISTRLVYITGAVMHPGAYTFTEHLSVVQLITIAGGISANYGDLQHIVIIRLEHGEPVSLYVNYEELRKGLGIKRNNIELQPGDQIIVP